MLRVKEEPFTVQDIYDACKGKTREKDMGILEVRNLYNERMGMKKGQRIISME